MGAYSGSGGGSGSTVELFLIQWRKGRGRFCDCDDSAAFGVAGGDPLRRAQNQVNLGLYVDSLVRVSRYPRDDLMDLLTQRC